MNHKVLLVAALVALALGVSVMALQRADVADAQGPKPTPPKPKAPSVSVDAGAAFAYKGQLKNSGALVNGSCNFNFGLWDDSAVGSQFSRTQTVYLEQYPTISVGAS